MRQRGTDNRPMPPALLRRIICIVSLFVTATICLAQSPAPASQPQMASFAGTWKSKFRNKTWLTLTLAPSGKGLTGTLLHALQVVANDSGEVTAVSEEMGDESKITRAELEGDLLTLRAEDSEGHADTYEMRLTGPDTAELRSTDGDDSPSTRKPVKVTRETVP